jgi:cytochrome c556
MNQKPLLIAIVSLITAVASSAHAADPDDMVKYRKNVMNANGGLMGATNALIQNKVEFKGQLVGYAKALEGLNKDLPALFPKGSNSTDSDAQPDVWAKRAEFERRAKDTQTKAASFAKAAAGNDPKLAEKYKELSDACKSCHKDFRK